MHGSAQFQRLRTCGSVAIALALAYNSLQPKHLPARQLRCFSVPAAEPGSKNATQGVAPPSKAEAEVLRGRGGRPFRLPDGRTGDFGGDVGLRGDFGEGDGVSSETWGKGRDPGPACLTPQTSTNLQAM